ncbi:DUF3240 family protein [Idiomarina seosinensis]|uniref:DUF3240 domain-containing protein n=1 Tax=Idiomarina seosinensis TaxID=281739 RepID=A0A432ZDY0_9GAMM|nr:DUF3240 family protein [Idiomarina seosinensis]RUO76175.1 DUF3240 domain-containing protein [Idiomarina seosinensis]
MPNKLIKLYFSCEQKVDLVDSLIQLDIISGFSLYAIDGFSRDHERFDISEQIKGSRRMMVAEIICSDDDITTVLKSLSNLHFREPIRYVIQPIENTGHLEDI